MNVEDLLRCSLLRFEGGEKRGSDHRAKHRRAGDGGEPGDLHADVRCIEYEFKRRCSTVRETRTATERAGGVSRAAARLEATTSGRAYL